MMGSDNHQYGANQMSREQLERAYIDRMAAAEMHLQASTVWFKNEKEDRAELATLRAENAALKLRAERLAREAKAARESQPFPKVGDDAQKSDAELVIRKAVK